MTSVTITSGVPESSSDDNTVIWLCVGAAVLVLIGIGIGIIVYCCVLKPKEESAESGSKHSSFNEGDGTDNTQASPDHKTELEL